MSNRSLFKEIARRGGLHRASEIRTPERLLSIMQLDDALWTATGVDIEYLALDRNFLKYLDSDGNGRILCGEARKAIQYLDSCLLDLSHAIGNHECISVADIRSDNADAQALIEAIKRMHSVIKAYSGSQAQSENKPADAITDMENKPDAFTSAGDMAELVVSMSEVELCRRILNDKPVSADGVVLPDAAGDSDLRGFLEEVIRSVGGELHPGGSLGVTIPEIEEFLEKAHSRLDWLGMPEKHAEIMILGSDTPRAFSCWQGILPRLTDYFELDALVAIDPALASEAARIPLETYTRSLGLDPENLSAAIAASRAAAPLALPEGKGALYLAAVRDPVAQEIVSEAFKAVSHILGKPNSTLDYMTRAEFVKINKAFAPYASWLASESGNQLAHLSAEMLAFLTSDSLVARARELIGERGAAALAADDIRTVECFLLFLRNLVPFLNNFVVFPYLYDPVMTAAFEAGSFVSDGRRFSFSVRVRDVAKHKLSARYSRMYVLYLEVQISGKPAYRVAVPVTTGSQGRLYRGKHGLFREPDGTERDAIIVDILENPISTLETLAMPFRKAYKAVATRMEEVSKKAEERLGRNAVQRTDATLSTELKPSAPTVSAHTASSRDETGTKAVSPTGSPVAVVHPKGEGLQPGAIGGLLVGGSIALAALGSSFAFISKTLSEMSRGAVLVTLGVVVAAILVPVLAAALLKLSSRDLSPLLEASGIAMNRRIRLSRSQAKAFTVSQKRMRSLHRRRTAKTRASRK